MVAGATGAQQAETGGGQDPFVGRHQLQGKTLGEQCLEALRDYPWTLEPTPLRMGQSRTLLPHQGQRVEMAAPSPIRHARGPVYADHRDTLPDTHAGKGWRSGVLAT